MYYTATDNLGSINMIVDGSTGQIVDDLSYDACSVKLGFWKRSVTKPIVEPILDCEANREGRNRNPYDWTYSNITLSNITDRGYTGHEHMTNFGLINMNGRVYDPYISQFLSPDPFVQDPTNTQNYNRFSYVLNNPLKYTDPSGYNYIDPNGNFVWGMGVKPSSNNADGAGKNNDWLSYWDNQWVNRDSDWGGVEETLNSLFDMGKNPKGFIRKGNGDIYYSWVSGKESEFKNEKVWLKKTRTFNLVLLFQNTSKKKNIKP